MLNKMRSDILRLKRTPLLLYCLITFWRFAHCGPKKRPHPLDHNARDVEAQRQTLFLKLKAAAEKIVLGGTLCIIKNKECYEVFEQDYGPCLAYIHVKDDHVDVYSDQYNTSPGTPKCSYEFSEIQKEEVIGQACHQAINYAFIQQGIKEKYDRRMLDYVLELDDEHPLLFGRSSDPSTSHQKPEYPSASPMPPRHPYPQTPQMQADQGYQPQGPSPKVGRRHGPGSDGQANEAWQQSVRQTHSVVRHPGPFPNSPTRQPHSSGNHVSHNYHNTHTSLHQGLSAPDPYQQARDVEAQRETLLLKLKAAAEKIVLGGTLCITAKHGVIQRDNGACKVRIHVMLDKVVVHIGPYKVSYKFSAEQKRDVIRMACLQGSYYALPQTYETEVGNRTVWDELEEEGGTYISVTFDSIPSIVMRVKADTNGRRAVIKTYHIATYGLYGAIYLALQGRKIYANRPLKGKEPDPMKTALQNAGYLDGVITIVRQNDYNTLWMCTSIYDALHAIRCWKYKH